MKNQILDYKSKITSTEVLKRLITPGKRIFIGSAAGEPQTLVETLIEMEKYIPDTEVVHILTFGTSTYAEQKLSQPFRRNAFFVGPNIRDDVNQGRADFTPIFLSEIGKLLRSGSLHIDIALIQTSQPDKYGFCSLGVSVDVVKPAIEVADIVVAEVNKQMPRTLGDSFIHISGIDYMIESDRPLLTIDMKEPDDVARQIGEYVALLIPNGATIQLGIGTIPNAICSSLKDKKDLGVHTEMFSDGLIELIEKGVVTNLKKTLNRGKVIAAFCMGSKELYEFANDNPLIEFHPCDYTNNPYIIAQNNKMISINAALQIDLTGQVCADSLGEYYYSGIGGQVDFVRGAASSNGGKPIIVMPSTAINETISRIVPTLTPGAGVVTSRGDVHYVITEYGIANLHGKNIRERAMLLIGISHPKFRDELLEYARTHNLVYQDQLSVSKSAINYPVQYQQRQRFKDIDVYFRPIKPEDEPLYRKLFYSLSEESKYYRFFNIVKAMPHEKLQHEVTVDFLKEMVIAGFIGDPGEEEEMIVVGKYVLDPSTNIAEVGILVHDQFQDKGIGTYLINYLLRIALDKGIEGFKAEILKQNTKMLHILHKTPFKVESKLEDDTYSMSIDFSSRKEKVPYTKTK